jgi:hypothetical protein
METLGASTKGEAATAHGNIEGSWTSSNSLILEVLTGDGVCALGGVYGLFLFRSRRDSMVRKLSSETLFPAHFLTVGEQRPS